MAPTNRPEDIPVSNRPPVILGVSIAFQTLAFLAVLFRLYARFCVVKSVGWDDLFVVLALLSVTTGTVFVCLSVYHGLGMHFSELNPTEIAEYLFRFYVANGTFVVSTTFIKVSLLLQYLRIYTEGLWKKICIGLAVVISLWGLVFSFMAWFPCFPIRAYWDWSLVDADCYAYGTKDREPFVSTYENHSAFNLAFDILVLALSIPMWWRRDRTSKEHWAIAGLAFLGSLVIVVSAWRLDSITRHQAGWEPVMDFTWYAPISVVLACLEVDFAIVAASMPVFWPMIQMGWSSIFVTQEVRITHQRRVGGYEIELGDAESPSDRGSEHGLKRYSSAATMENSKNPYTVEQFDPTRDDQPTSFFKGDQASLRSNRKKKWNNVLGVF